MFHLDYETRSKADLKKYGAYRYASDKSALILMAAIAKGDEEPSLWLNPIFFKSITQSKAERRLAEAFESGYTIYAHNAEFERALSKYRAEKDLGLIAPPNSVWRCTAAMARRAALPWSLLNIAKTLKLEEQKDPEGHALMRFFSIPRKEDGEFNDPNAFPEKFMRFGKYCVQDTKTERAVEKALAPFAFDGDLLKAFQLDAEINDYGIPVNVKALKIALDILDQTEEEVTAKFRKLTGINPTQRAKIKKLIEEICKEADEDFELEDMTKKSVADKTEDETLPSQAREILRTYSLLSFAAGKKVKAMLGSACPDGRVRGSLLFMGAIRTGRWAGRLIQPQNFKIPMKQADLAYDLLCSGFGKSEIELLWKNSAEVIAGIIRLFIHPEAGCWDVDYNAVEARIACWLGGQKNVLKMFKDGIDLYCVMGSRIYGYKVEKINGETTPERELGKRAFLGCGFQMGAERFQITCEKYGSPVTLALAEKAVLAYRELCDKVKATWWALDRAARRVIMAGDKPCSVQVGEFLTVYNVTVSKIPYLAIMLPSGRPLLYPWPEINKDEITYFGMNRENAGKWGRVKIYGGKFFENTVQATAADLIMNGSGKAWAEGYRIFMSVHDQVLSERDKGQSCKEFTALLADVPEWALSLPLKAEGKERLYYTK